MTNKIKISTQIQKLQDVSIALQKLGKTELSQELYKFIEKIENDEEFLKSLEGEK